MIPLTFPNEARNFLYGFRALRLLAAGDNSNSS
jgi:hypothetical protein